MLACILQRDGRASAQLGVLMQDFIVRVPCPKALQLTKMKTICSPPPLAAQNFP